MRIAPLILCYHAVSPSWTHEMAVPPEALERQLERLLARGFRPVVAAEAIRQGGNVLHVTFDDGLRSILNAVPTLERLKVPTTVFACVTCADRHAPLDVPELRAELEAHPDELATLSWAQLRELTELGIEIGSHTMRHPHLTALADEELAYELGESRRRIEDELARPCHFLAYPYGEHDARVRRATQAAGYQAAFALPAAERLGDPFQVGRVGVWQADSSLELRLKTSAPMRTAAGLAVVRSIARLRRLGQGTRSARSPAEQGDS
jgi:peptidoglycan/xylan/chitin deacetylase (PgdA/CDA1 family)